MFCYLLFKSQSEGQIVAKPHVDFCYLCHNSDLSYFFTSIFWIHLRLDIYIYMDKYYFT